MRDHPSDTRYLDGLPWVDGCCEVCRRSDQDVAVQDGVRLCREDLRWLLHFTRCLGSGSGTAA
ncbi:hypothetical protein GXW82_22080 [Streptacidiphilus sp. 4-A2]|nr:hypothetical protein [Streptacidiphilus sp. 4-A2]